jgi:peptide/nickel transport system ATP-binding protein/oligopeptide transport system ATP-binding protein
MSSPEATPLLQVQGLAKHYATTHGAAGRGVLKAVDGVDLSIRAGDSFGIVGESGSGKSTLARLLLRLIPPSAGQVRFDGQDITALQGQGLRQLRRHMQIVFQNPHSALNGRHTLSDAVGEPLRLQDRLSGSALQARVAELMSLVGLPAHFLHRYPHELSGGQKQRVCIARALALNPRLVVLDEPTSALDVSVQAQILELLRDLQRERQLTYIFISHNLAVVRALCNRVAVMYLGKVLEQGDTDAVFGQPQHPYTQALLAAAPRLHDPQAPVLLQGDVPSASRMPPGCRFHTRCTQAQVPACRSDEPPLQRVAPGQDCACFLRLPVR